MAQHGSPTTQRRRVQTRLRVLSHLSSGRLYQFTAIDEATRYRVLKIKPGEHCIGLRSTTN